MSKLTSKNQLGFSVVEVLLVLVILGAIVFAGIYVFNKNKDSADESTDGTPQTSQQEINNADDLQSTEDDLNDIKLDDLDTTELDDAEADLL